MCGMCLPHCPTYRVYQNESESPRGRISLIQAYAQGRLSTDSSMTRHLDHCLGCMACEAMCPSRVPYGRLLDEARAAMTGTRPPWLQRKLLDTVARESGPARYAPLMKLAGFPGISAVVKGIAGRLSRAPLALWLNELQPQTFKSRYPATAASGRCVTLFTGCMDTLFDAETLNSSIHLLNRLGFDVQLPEKTRCCGALHQHGGQPEEAEKLARGNAEIFEHMDSKTVIFTSNGCGARLKETRGAFQVTDIASFLMAQAELTDLPLSPGDTRVLVHESCSSQNRLGLGGISEKLLEWIPGIQLSRFDSASLCCGAGGSHQLTEPDLSARLRDIKIDEIRRLEPDYLVTDNLGCGLNFKTGLAQHGIELEVIHPVTLLARRLK